MTCTQGGRAAIQLVATGNPLSCSVQHSSWNCVQHHPGCPTRLRGSHAAAHGPWGRQPPRGAGHALQIPHSSRRAARAAQPVPCGPPAVADRAAAELCYQLHCAVRSQSRRGPALQLPFNPPCTPRSAAGECCKAVLSPAAALPQPPPSGATFATAAGPCTPSATAGSVLRATPAPALPQLPPTRCCICNYFRALHSRSRDEPVTQSLPAPVLPEPLPAVATIVSRHCTPRAATSLRREHRRPLRAWSCLPPARRAVTAAGSRWQLAPGLASPSCHTAAATLLSQEHPIRSRPPKRRPTPPQEPQRTWTLPCSSGRSSSSTLPRDTTISWTLGAEKLP